MRDDLPKTAHLPISDPVAARAVLLAALELLKEAGWAAGSVSAVDRRGAPCRYSDARARMYAAGAALGRVGFEAGLDWLPVAEAQRLLTRAVGMSPARFNEIAQSRDEVFRAYERAIRLAEREAHSQQSTHTQLGAMLDVQA